jgi:hypothetical protein
MFSPFDPALYLRPDPLVGSLDLIMPIHWNRSPASGRGEQKLLFCLKERLVLNPGFCRMLQQKKRIKMSHSLFKTGCICPSPACGRGEGKGIKFF